MNSTSQDNLGVYRRWQTYLDRSIKSVFRSWSVRRKHSRISPFWVIVNKEISDHIRGWRFVILIVIIALACMGSLYTALANFKESVKVSDLEDSFVFLRLFTASDGSMPSFIVFISFLGPLFGISLGFDAVNSEQIKGTLSRVLAQPINRDYLINAKFVAALVVISVMFFALGFMVMGIGLIAIGIPPTAAEFLRFVCFLIVSVFYVAFWVNLSILFSVRFRQPATSALSGIAVWLFFTVFYELIVNFIAKTATSSAFPGVYDSFRYKELVLKLLSILPSQLFNDATTVLLVPSVRSLGPLSMEQMIGSIPSPLPLGQSLLIIWPQLTGLIAVTMMCFGITYVLFMRREIRSR